MDKPNVPDERSVVPSQQNNITLQPASENQVESTTGSAGKTGEKDAEIDDEPTKSKKPKSLEFKAGIWDDLFGGIKTEKKKDPADLIQFESQVNKCIDHLNSVSEDGAAEEWIKKVRVLTNFEKIDKLSRHILAPTLSTYNYAYTDFHKFIAFSGLHEVEVFRVKPVDDHHELDPKVRYTDLPLLLPRIPPMITRNGKFLIVATVEDIRCYCISKYMSQKFRIADLSKPIVVKEWPEEITDYPESYHMLMSRYAVDHPDPKINEKTHIIRNIPDPDFLDIYISSADHSFLIEFNFIEEFASANVSVIIQEIPITQANIELVSALEEPITDEEQFCSLLRMNTPRQTALVKLSPTTTSLTFYELALKSEAGGLEFQAKPNPFSFPVGLDGSLLANLQSAGGMLVLPSSDCKSIQSLRYEDEEVRVVKLFDLPPSVSNINDISFNRKLDFVLLNTNLGELQVWSRTKSGDKAYEQILQKELPEQKTRIRLTEDLHFIITSNKKSVNFIQFDPFSNDITFTSYHIPWIKNLIKRSIGKQIDSGFPPVRFVPFNEGSALVYIFNDNLAIYDLGTKCLTGLKNPLAFIPEWNSVKTSEVITLIPGFHWLFYLSCQESESTDPDEESKSHFLVFSILRREKGIEYQIEQAVDVVTDDEVDYVPYKNIVLIQTKSSNSVTIMRFMSHQKLKGKLYFLSNEFDIQERLGITSIVAQQDMEPLLGFVNSELGIIVRKPKDMMELVGSAKQQAKAKIAKSAKNNDLSFTKQGIMEPRRAQVKPQRPGNLIKMDAITGLDSDLDDDVSPQQIQVNEEFTTFKSSAGRDPDPDNDSMDENLVKIESSGSKAVSKRPPAGSYELFTWALLFRKEPGRIKLLKLGKIHCSGANFIKSSPSGNLICIFGNSGFELLKLRVNTASSIQYEQELLDREQAELTKYLESETHTINDQVFSGDKLPTLPPKNAQPYKELDGMIAEAKFKERPVQPESSMSELLYRIQTSSKVVKADIWQVNISSAKLVTLRFRWKPRYKISSLKSVEISDRIVFKQLNQVDCIQAMAISFEQGCCYLYRIENESLVIPHRLSKDTPPKHHPFFFKFIVDKDKQDQDRDLLMSSSGTGKHNDWIYLYSVCSKVVLNTVFIRKTKLPVNLEFGYYSKTHDESSAEVIQHSMKAVSEEEYRNQNFLGYLVNESRTSRSNIAFGHIIYRNLHDYFTTQDPKTENICLNMVKSSFKSVGQYEYLQDPRMMITLYVLNLPGLFKECLSHVKIEDLINSNDLLCLIFSNLNPPRSNSEKDVAEMYEDCVKTRGVQPDIPMNLIQRMISNCELDALTGTQGCKKILSMIIMSPTQQIVHGLTSSRDISLVPFPESNTFEDSLPRDVIIKKVDCLLLSNPANSNDYEVYRTPIPLEFTNGSQFSIGFFQTLQKLPDEELQYKYKQIINYKWRMVYFHSLVYTLLFIALNALVYLYFGYMERTWMGIVVLIMNLMFIGIDVKMFGSSLLAFSKNLNSWIDIMVHVISASACIITLFNLVASTDIVLYIKVIAILAISVRGIIQMKVFSGIRILIMLIGQIIIDLAWVPIVLGVVFILAGSIYTLVPQPDGTRNTDLTFYESMRQTFVLLFIPTTNVVPDVETNNQGRLIRTFITVVAGSMLVQGIFNFVIAIFLQTFKKINENKEIYELRSLLIEITDYDLMLKFLGKHFVREVKYNFLVLVPVPKDGVVFENETRFDRLNNIKDSLMTEMGKKSLELMGEQAKKIIGDKKDEIDKLVALGKENAKPTDPRVSKLVGALDNFVKTGDKPGMNDLSNLADLMSEGLDDKSRGIVKNTQKAVQKSADLLSSLKLGESPTAESMLDIVILMAEAMDPSGEKGLASKLTKLKTTILSIVGMAEKIKNHGKIDLPMVIDAAVAVADQLTTGPIREKLVALGNSIKVISEEGTAIVQGKSPDFTKVVNTAESFLNTMDVGKIDLGPTKMVASVLTEVFKSMDELKKGGYKDPDTLLRIGGDITHVVLPDSGAGKIFESSRQILKCVKEYSQLSSADSSNATVALASIMIKSAGGVVTAIYPEAESAVKTINDLCSAIESTSKSLKSGTRFSITDVATAVKPLITKYLGDEGKKGVEGVVELIRLVEHQVSVLSSNMDKQSKTSASLEQLPELLQGASNLIKIFVSDDQRVQSALDIAILSARLVQSRLDQSNSSNSLTENIFQTTLMAVDVMSIISPKVKSMSVTLKKSLEILNRQFKNLSTNPNQIDLESLMEDLGTLTIAANKDWSDVVTQITKVSRITIQEVKALKSSREEPQIQYLRAGCRILNAVSASTSKITAATLALVDIGTEISKSQSLKRTVDLTKIFQLASQVAHSFDPNVEALILQSKPIVELIAFRLSGQNFRGIEAVQSSIRMIGNMVMQIEPKTKDAVVCMTNFTDGLLTFVQSSSNSGALAFESMNIEKLLSPLCKIMEQLRPDLVQSTVRFQHVAVALQHTLMSFKDETSKDTQAVVRLIRGVGQIVQDIEPRFAAPVDKLLKLAAVIQVGVQEYENPTIDGLTALIDSTGDLLCECDSTLRPKVNQTLSVIKLIANEVKTVGSGDPMKMISDPKDGLRALFSCLKTILTRYQPSYAPVLAKIELLISGLAIQLEGFQRTGKIDLESGLVTANSMIRELAPELQQPSEMIGAFISIISGASSLMKNDSKSLKPSEADWGKIVQGVTQLAQTCKYEHSDLIRVVGENIQPMLAELEAVLGQANEGFKFGRLFRLLAFCVNNINPELQEYIQIAELSLGEMEDILIEQHKTKEIDVLSIMNSAIKIVSRTTNSNSIQVEAFAGVFKEVRDQVLSLSSGQQMGAKDALDMFKRINIIVQKVLGKYSAKSVETCIQIQSATELLIKTIESSKNIQKPSEVLSMVGSLLTSFKVPKMKKLEDVTTIVIMFENLQAVDSNRFDIGELVDSAVKLMKELLPAELQAYSAPLKEVLKCVKTVSIELRGSGQIKPRLAAITQAAIEVVRITKPELEPRVRQVAQLIELVEFEAEHLQMSLSSGQSNFKNVGMIVQSVHRILPVIDPTKILYLDRVASLLSKVDEKLISKGYELQNLDSEACMRVMANILNEIQPLVKNPENMNNLLDTIIQLHGLMSTSN